jgi:tRNA (guanine6-N2)-methyltransferase
MITYYEIEHITGLQEMVQAELAAWGMVRLLPATRPDGVPFVVDGGKTSRVLSLPRLAALRLPTAVYAVLHYDIPRPKALLGQQHWQRLLATIQAITQPYPRATFRTFRLSAAGQDTAVVQRLKQQLAQDTQLELDEEATHLYLRLRPSQPPQKPGWELLIRLTPLPLATRPWRTTNYPGALSGPVCSALHQMVGADPSDRVLNFMCGSGSLLAERLTPARWLVGLDNDPTALAAARANLAHLHPAPHLLLANAQQMPLPDNSVDLLLADLPWGQLVGQVGDLAGLYTAVFQEATRLATPTARWGVVTADTQRWERALSQHPAWRIVQKIRLDHGRVRPTLYHLSPLSLR